MPRRIVTALSVALIGVSSTAWPADANEAEDAQEIAALREAKLSLGEAIALAEKQLPGGRVVEFDIDTEDDVVSYVIDVEKDGVRTVTIDVRTGEVIRVAAQEADEGDQTDDDARKADQADPEDDAKDDD